MFKIAAIRFSSGQGRWRPPRQDEIDLQANQFAGQGREAFVAAV